MVKAYLRYDFTDQCCLVNSSGVGSVFSYEGKTVFSPSNEFIYQWSPRTNQRISQLSIHEENLDISMHTVTCIQRHPLQENIVAAGYHNGSIILWNIELKSQLATFYGHKSKVNVLHFSLDGHLLVSGGSDTDIVVWDVTSHLGLFRLCGHTNQVTVLRFLHKKISIDFHGNEPLEIVLCKSLSKRKTKKSKRSNTDVTDDTADSRRSEQPNEKSLFTHFSRTPHHLLSASKDGTVKLWDLTAQYCIQTLFNPSGEVSALVVNPTETRVIVGTSSHHMRAYTIEYNTTNNDQTKLNSTCEADDFLPTLRELGCLLRPSQGSRITQMFYAVDAHKLFCLYRQCGYCLESIQQDISGDISRHHQITCYGTLLTRNNTHAACEDHQQLILSLVPENKCLEVYREFTPSERRKRCEKRLRRHSEKLKKKMKKLRELNRACEEFEQKLGSGKRTAIGTTYEAEREAILHKIQLIEVESEKIRNELRLSDTIQISDEFTFLHNFLFKKTVSFMDYHLMSRRLLLTHQDTYLSIVTFPLTVLLQLKTKISRPLLQQGESSSINLEDLSLQETSEEISQGHPGSLQYLFISHDDAIIGALAKKVFFVWNLDSLNLIGSMELSGKGHCGFFVVGNAHAVIGTTMGSIVLIDLSTRSVIKESCKIHNGVVQAVAEHPKNTGFATVGTDKKLCFFRFKVVESMGDHDVRKEILEYEELESFQLPDEGCDIKFTNDAKYLAVALLDFTVQIFFVDSMKVFLTLYGHKLPCTSLDISSDCTLLVTGSCDKTIKLWGLDFGNIQRSWHAHEGDITQVRFIKHTHYIVSGGKDGHIIFWDGDRGELVYQIQHHSKPVVSLRMTRLDADRIFAAMSDGAVRIWTRTNDQIFAHEEQEKLLENKLVKKLVEGDNSGDIEVFRRPTRKAALSINSTEQLLESIELCAEASRSITLYKDALATWKSMGSPNDPLNAMTKPITPPPCVQFMGLSPHRYLYRVLSQIPSSLHYEIVVALPFVFVEKLLCFLGDILEENHLMMKEGSEHPFTMAYTIETVARISLLLIHLHARQFMVFPLSRHNLAKVHRHLRPILLCQKEILEQNKSAFTVFQQVQEPSYVL